MSLSSFTYPRLYGKRRITAIPREVRSQAVLVRNPQDDELGDSEDETSTLDTWEMEDEELFTTFNSALDDLNLESEQAVLLRRLLADIDVSGNASAESPVRSAYVEELPTKPLPTRSHREWLGGFLKTFRRGRGDAYPSARGRGSESYKSRTKLFTWTRVQGLLRTTKKMVYSTSVSGRQKVS